MESVSTLEPTYQDFGSASSGQVDGVRDGYDERELIGVGSEVFAFDGHVGTVSRLLQDPHSGQVTYLVVRTRRFLGGELVVPLKWVVAVSPEEVHLFVTRQQVDGQPRYRPDAVIADDVTLALWDDDFLRPQDLVVVRAEAHNGVVILLGHVESEAHSRRVESAVRRVRGVLEVSNQLVVDDELVAAVARALGDDPRTRSYSIVVRASRGLVGLVGRDSSPAFAQAAEEVGASVPGVRAVVYQPMGTEWIAPQRVLVFPRVGSRVYATDGELGQVEMVVLDPRSRRVTQLICAVRCPIPKGDVMPPWRRRVVPAGSISVATREAVLLGVDSEAVACMPEYWEDCFAVPEDDWRPGFDYRREDVRFASEETVSEPGPAA